MKTLEKKIQMAVKRTLRKSRVSFGRPAISQIQKIREDFIGKANWKGSPSFSKNYKNYLYR